MKIFDPTRYRVRKLTPTEYGRLQAFPMDSWEQVVSDSQAYKQFGNAVTVNVVQAIAEEIKKSLSPSNSLKTYNVDCKEFMKTMPDNSVDLIFTDPPYNIAQYSTGNISLPGRKTLNNDIADWDNVPLKPKELLADFKRILKPNGNIFVFASYNRLGEWHEIFDPEFDTFQFFVWHKTNPTPKIYKSGFLNSCEIIICMWNKGHKWNFTKQNEMHNFFESPICMQPERLKEPKHPAQKPVKLLKHIINIASNPDDVVFDPFMGVGSTGVACAELGRRFVGCEIDNTYYSAAKERLGGIK